MIPVSGTVTQTSPPRKNMRNTFLITGILHAVFATCDVIFGIVAIVYKAWFSYFGIPIWGGILVFGVTGFLGICAAARNHKGGLRGAYLIMSIISACLAGSMVLVFAFGADNDAFISRYYYHQCRPGTYLYYCYTDVSIRIGMNSTLCVVAFFEMILAIFSASAACFYACSCCRQQRAQNYHAPPVYFQQGGAVLSQGAVSHQGGMAFQSADNRFVVVSPQQIPMQTGQVPPGQMVYLPHILQGTQESAQQNQSNLAVALPQPAPQGNPGHGGQSQSALPPYILSSETKHDLP